MRTPFTGHALAGVVAAAVMSAAFQASPVLAQDQSCTCLLSSSTGALGTVSQANPDVFAPVSGFPKPQVVRAGFPLKNGSVVTTGANGDATINLGSFCTFAMGATMHMQIVPATAQAGKLCVQVFDDTVTGAVGDAGAVGEGLNPGLVATIAAGVGIGAGVLVFSLGQKNSVSRQ